MIALERISYRLAKMAAWLSAGIMIYMVLHVLLEITLRVFFARSTYVLDEFVAYATASITFLCLAYALHDNALIRVGMLLQRFHGRPRLILELFSLATMICIVAMVTYYFWTKTFWRDLVRGTVSESIAEMPLWIPEIFALIGLGLFGLQLITMLLRLIVGGSSATSGGNS
ncbi:MAG: TRAP transporter small permease [Desulfobacterales bacterium]|jgi:TRAP-type C4-dicarboxylate transport system permease small subunit